MVLYQVTNQDVEVGSVLFSEMPYSSVLLSEHYATHCHHCYLPFIAPVPCFKCTQPRYCSDQVNKFEKYGSNIKGEGVNILEHSYVYILSVSSRIMGGISPVRMYLLRFTSFGRHCSFGCSHYFYRWHEKTNRTEIGSEKWR